MSPTGPLQQTRCLTSNNLTNMRFLWNLYSTLDMGLHCVMCILLKLERHLNISNLVFCNMVHTWHSFIPKSMSTVKDMGFGERPHTCSWTQQSLHTSDVSFIEYTMPYSLISQWFVLVLWCCLVVWNASIPPLYGCLLAAPTCPPQNKTQV